MIQRVQSIYMLLVTILMSVFLFSSYAYGDTAPGGQIFLFPYAFKMQGTASPELISKTLPLLILVILTGAISFINIFFFSKRWLQLRICLVTILLVFVQLAFMYYYYAAMKNDYETVHSTFKFPLILPVLCIVILIMAYRGIRHDEALVSSYNRIR
jgi:hypothetical protein